MGKTGPDQTRKMNSNTQNLNSTHLDSWTGNFPITSQNAPLEFNCIDYRVPLISWVTREPEFFKIKAHFCFQTIFKNGSFSTT